MSRDKRWLVAATAVNAIGTGTYLPVSLIILVKLSSLALSTVGTVLTVTALVALFAMPAAGMLVDRWGARRFQVAVHVARMLGFLGFIAADSWAVFVVSATLVALGSATSRIGQVALIADVTTGTSRERYLAADRALNNAGLGLGGLVAAALLSAGGRTANVVVALIVASSYLLAAGCVALIKVAGPAASERRESARFRTILGNQEFRKLTLANACSAFGYSALPLFIPIFAVISQGLPPALAGGLFTLNTVLCAAGGVPVAAGIIRSGLSRRRAAQIGLLLMAGGLAMMLPVLVIDEAWLGSVVLVAAVGVYTLGELGHSPTSTALALDAATDTEKGQYMAVYQTSWSLASALAPLVFTALIALHPSAVIILLCALNAVAVALLGKVDLSGRGDRQPASDELSSSVSLAPIGVDDRCQTLS